MYLCSYQIIITFVNKNNVKRNELDRLLELNVNNAIFAIDAICKTRTLIIPLLLLQCNQIISHAKRDIRWLPTN